MSEPPDDPFAESRRPFRIAAIGLAVLAVIAWMNGWIVPFWEG